MSWRYSGLVMLCLLVSLLPRTLEVIISRDIRPSALLIPHYGTQDDTQNDAESVFARGDKLPLRCADVSTLEMIRGIADTVAFQLVAGQEQVQAAYQRGYSELEALQRVHGVGPATAVLLSRYVRLEGLCGDDARFNPARVRFD